MTVYANLVDGQVLGVYDLIPRFWNNINNFDIKCQNEADYMRDNGFVKITKPQYVYDTATQKLSDFPTYRVENGEVIEQREILTIEIPPPPLLSSAAEILLQVRQVRDQLMRDFEWRYTRYFRQQRLGINTTDSLAALDTYMQALADITTQEDLSQVIWPQYSAESLANQN